MNTGSFWKHLIPPPQWRVVVVLLCGVIVGLGLYAVYAGKAWSYLSDAPETCVNCHIMAPQYATWQHSSHREHAACTDCHVPHDNIFRTYFLRQKTGCAMPACSPCGSSHKIFLSRKTASGLYRKTAFAATVNW